MKNIFRMASAWLVLGTLLLASTTSLSPVLAQQPQTENNGGNTTIQDQANNNTVSQIVDPINQTEAEEILDNVEEANQAIFRNNAVAALQHLDNIRGIITGAEAVVQLFFVPEDLTANNDSETGNTLDGSGNNNSTNNDDNGLLEPVIPSSGSLANNAEIVPIQQQTTTTTPQEQQQQGNRTFRVTFERLHINADHDPLFSGEWVMDAYVNEEIVPLFPGSISVDDGEVVELTENNVATVTVPADRGEIRIVTVGFENDIGFDAVPIISPILEMDIPFDAYTARAQDAVADYVLAEANDPNGFVEKRFTAADNFGIGAHSDCSEPNDFALDDPQGFLDTKCDFRLEYRIEEVQ